MIRTTAGIRPRSVALWVTTPLTLAWLAFLGLFVGGGREGWGYALVGLVFAPVGAGIVFALVWAAATLVLPTPTVRGPRRRASGSKGAFTAVAVAPPVRHAIRRNWKKVPAALILLATVTMVVRYRAQEALLREAWTTPSQPRQRAIMEQALRNNDEDVLTSLAANPQAAPDVLTLVGERWLLAPPAIRERYLPSLAGNPATPESILRRLAALADSFTDDALVKHPSLPADTRALVEKRRQARLDREAFLRGAASAHP